MSDAADELDLSEFEQQIVEVFEQRGGEGPPDEPTSPPSPGGGDGEQAPSEPVTDGAAPDLPFIEPPETPETPETPDPDATPDQIAGEGDPSTDGSDASPSPVSPFDDLSDDQLTVARGVYDWYASLDQSAVAQVDAVLSGQYVLVPAEQVQQLEKDWNLLEQVKRGVKPDASDYPDVTPDLDDDTDPELRELRERVERVEQDRYRAEMEAQLAQTAQTIDSVWEAWKGDHAFLDDKDFRFLENELVQSGIYAPLAAKYGDEQAVAMALDQLLYANPALREKALQPVIDQRLQQELQTAQAQQARGTRASAISGSAPSPPDQNAAPIDPDEAMVEEIARALRGEA